MNAETRTVPESVGALQRIQLAVAALLGDSAAKHCREALRGLDEHKRWHTFTFGGTAGEEPTFRVELAALEEFGGTERGQEAADLQRALAGAERESLGRLGSGYAAVAERQWQTGLDQLPALARLRESTSESLAAGRSLAEAQRTAQRAAWDVLATSGAAVRAGRLLELLGSLPEIPELPRPDVTAFSEPYERAIALVPAEFREGEDGAICFDADTVGELARTAVATAPGAEEALTRYLYEAARGYEAALGRERAAQVLVVLRDPAALRDLRVRRPELFEAEYATTAGMADLLPLLFVTALLAEQAPGWQQPAPLPPRPSSAPTGPIYDLAAWDLPIPTAGELREVLAASEALGGEESREDSAEEGGEEREEDSAAGFDDSADDGGSDSDSGGDV